MSRVICSSWRIITARACAASASEMFGEPQDLDRRSDGRERVAQLVGERRQELVLPAVGAFERFGALQHAALEVDVHQLQRLLRRLPLGDLAPEQFVRLRDRPPSPVEIDEHRDLRLEDVAVDRLGQIVDRAAVVAAQHVALVQHVRREKQDRDVARPPPLLDDLGELQAAHPRHLDVEDDRGELLIEQREQRFVGRVRGHEPAPALRQ